VPSLSPASFRPSAPVAAALASMGLGRPGGQQLSRAAKTQQQQLKKKKANVRYKDHCDNCLTTQTPQWRKGRRGETFCQDCGRSERRHDYARLKREREKAIEKTLIDLLENSTYVPRWGQPETEASNGSSLVVDTERVKPAKEKQESNTNRENQEHGGNRMMFRSSSEEEDDGDDGDDGEDEEQKLAKIEHASYMSDGELKVEEGDEEDEEGDMETLVKTHPDGVQEDFEAKDIQAGGNLTAKDEDMREIQAEGGNDVTLGKRKKPQDHPTETSQDSGDADGADQCTENRSPSSLEGGAPRSVPASPVKRRRLVEHRSTPTEENLTTGNHNEANGDASG